jgi:hypothetical protein
MFQDEVNKEVKQSQAPKLTVRGEPKWQPKLTFRITDPRTKQMYEIATPIPVHGPAPEAVEESITKIRQILEKINLL